MEPNEEIIKNLPKVGDIVYRDKIGVAVCEQISFEKNYQEIRSLGRQSKVFYEYISTNGDILIRTKGLCASGISHLEKGKIHMVLNSTTESKDEIFGDTTLMNFSFTFR